MKASEVVDQLAAEIPKYTTGFTNSVGITSIAPVGLIATVTTDAAHGMANGQATSIVGTQTPVEINPGTFLRTGTTATFNTIQDHDLTLSESDIKNGGKTVTISGATEPEFNGVFELSSIPNRNTVVIVVPDSGSTTISGSPVIENGGVDTFNGWFEISNVTANTFDVLLDRVATVIPIITGAKVQTSIRIGAVLDITQYLRDVYTAKGLSEDQLIVQLGDVSKSKRRDEQTDATGSDFGNYAHTPTLIQPFAVYVIQNVTDQLSAAPARDLIESEYFPAIMRALERAKFSSGLSYDYGSTTFVGHGVFAYADESGKNKAIYVHEVTFEQLARVTKDDAFDPNVTVAMRDVGYTFTTNIGTGIETMTANANLDEV